MPWRMAGSPSIGRSSTKAADVHRRPGGKPAGGGNIRRIERAEQNAAHSSVGYPSISKGAAVGVPRWRWCRPSMNQVKVTIDASYLRCKSFAMQVICPCASPACAAPPAALTGRTAAASRRLRHVTPLLRRIASRAGSQVGVRAAQLSEPSGRIRVQ